MLWYNLLKIQARAVQKESTAKYYFAKHDPDETICEKITRLNILPNQFYAVLDIFWHWNVGSVPHQIFVWEGGGGGEEGGLKPIALLLI